MADGLQPPGRPSDTLPRPKRAGRLLSSSCFRADVYSPPSAVQAARLLCPNRIVSRTALGHKCPAGSIRIELIWRTLEARPVSDHSLQIVGVIETRPEILVLDKNVKLQSHTITMTPHRRVVNPLDGERVIVDGYK